MTTLGWTTRAQSMAGRLTAGEAWKLLPRSRHPLASPLAFMKCTHGLVTFGHERTER